MPKLRLKSEWKIWIGIGAIVALLIGSLYIASRPPMEGGEYLWRVMTVIDEKTLRLKGSGQTIDFVLIGLEIPEAQVEATQNLLRKTLQDEWVRMKTLREDPKGLTEGLVFHSGEDVLARLIRQGLATVDRKEKSFDVRPYIELELEAKTAKKGLWSKPGPGAK